MKFNNCRLFMSVLMITATFLFMSAVVPTSEAHILVIGDSLNDTNGAYIDTKNIANMLKAKNYSVVTLYKENATSKNILKGMYGADAIIYEGHGGYMGPGYYDMNGGKATPPFGLVGSDYFVWGVGDKMSEGYDETTFKAPYKKNIPVILMQACFSTGWVEDKEVANPTQTVYNFARMFTGSGANYYATGWGSEIIPYLIDGLNFADANKKTYIPITESTTYNGTQIWRNQDGKIAFVGNWSAKFPTASETTRYNNIAAEQWYNSNRKTGYDTINPTITNVNPPNYATNVSRDKNIIITFSETIKMVNTAKILLQSNSGTVIPTTKSIKGNILTISHSGLLMPGTLYKIVLNNGTVADLTGNLLKAKVLSFSTSKDITPPKIYCVNPKNGATGVYKSGTISIRFNENILAGKNWSKVTIKNKYGQTCSITKQITGNHIYIKTNRTKSSYSYYTVYIPSAAIKDYAGNNLAAAYTFKFKTGA